MSEIDEIRSLLTTYQSPDRFYPADFRKALEQVNNRSDVCGNAATTEAEQPYACGSGKRATTPPSAPRAREIGRLHDWTKTLRLVRFSVAEFEAAREAMDGPSLADIRQKMWDGLRDDLNHPGRILHQPKPRAHWNQSKVRSLGGIALPLWQRIALKNGSKP